MKTPIIVTATLAAALAALAPAVASAQGEGPAEAETEAETEAEGDSSPATGAKQNAIYNRPFVVRGQRAALGGYVETHLNYGGTDGIEEGPGFEMRRFNLFVFSPIGQRMRFLSELEFEHGTEEIALETALLDVEIVPEFILRGGILLTPLGAFNQAHDGPIWDFTDRPLVSTQIIPSTFSEVGAGAHGTFLIGPLDLDYQLYATQGVGDGVVDNDLGRTAIPAGKGGALFEEDNNGEPAATGRLALRYGSVVEVGVSGYHGAWNSYVAEGEEVDARRTLTIAAVDVSVAPEWFQIRGEAAWATVEVPDSLASTYGEAQWGFHLDAVVPVWRFVALGADSQLDLGLRFEHVDLHAGELPTTGAQAGRETTRLVGAVAFRPGTETVFRLNYGYGWLTDLADNPPAQEAKLQVGVATYF